MPSLVVPLRSRGFGPWPSFNQVDGDELRAQALGPVRYELLEEDAPEWVAEPCQVPARVGHAACHARLQVKLLRTRSVRAACASLGFGEFPCS